MKKLINYLIVRRLRKYLFDTFFLAKILCWRCGKPTPFLPLTKFLSTSFIGGQSVRGLIHPDGPGRVDAPHPPGGQSKLVTYLLANKRKIRFYQGAPGLGPLGKPHFSLICVSSEIRWSDTPLHPPEYIGGHGRTPKGFEGGSGRGSNRFSENLIFKRFAAKFFSKVSRRFSKGQKKDCKCDF